MKNSILKFLVIGVTIIFFGCSEDNFLAPELDQSDQVSSLKSAKVKTPFSGNCTFLELLDPGEDKILPNGKTLRTGYVSQWKDNSDDPLVAGISTWTMNWLIEEDGITAKIWGKAEILLNDGRGKWKLSFHGNVTNTEVGMIIEDVCVGTGKEGEVEGMVAKWAHKMDFDFSNPATFVYNFEGSYH